MKLYFEYFMVNLKSELQYKTSFIMSFISQFFVFFGYYFTIICLFDKFENLKVGDYFDVDESYKILEIKDNFVKISDDYDNIYYYKIENPNQISSIYKNSLSKIL